MLYIYMFLQIAWLYRLLLGEAFAEFRYHQHKLRTMSEFCDAVDDGCNCPACPQVCKTAVCDIYVSPLINFLGPPIK